MNIINNQEIDFMVGADPEFIATTKNNRTVRAADEVPPGEDRSTAPLGADGNADTFEVRPAPSNEPLQVVNNIHRIFASRTLKANGSRFHQYDWHAGSCHAGRPIGGHIHIGCGDKISTKAAAPIMAGYLGSIFTLIENAKQGKDRRAGGYGNATDCRTQPHGFEYRTVASWLTSPHVASFFLCLAKTVMYEVLNNKKFTPSFNLRSVEIAINDQNKEAIYEIFPLIWGDVQKMKLYEKYRQHLEFGSFLVKNKRTWFPKSSMQAAWGIADLNVPNSKYSIGRIWSGFGSKLA